MESAFNDTLIANVTTGAATAVSRYVYLKDSSGVRIDSTGEMVGYQAQNLSFQQHYDADGVSYLGSSTAVLWPDKGDYVCASPFRSNGIYQGAYGNGVFVVATDGVLIGVSNDGKTWQEGKPPTGEADFTFAIVSVFGGDKFVTAGYDGKIAYSYDGLRWTSVTPLFSTRWIRGYYANGRFFLGSNAGDVATSADGVTWTSVSGTFGGGYVNGFYFANGLYFVFGVNGELHSSPDGLTWTARTSQFSTSEIAAMAYGAGTYVAVGQNGKVSSSPDGVTWTARTSGFPTDFTGYIYSVAYGAGLFIIVGGDVGGAGSIATSPTGATWTARTSPDGAQTLTHVYYTSNLFIAMGGAFITSPDGITWTHRTSGFTSEVHNFMVQGDGLYIVAGLAGSTTTSRDLLTWTNTTFVLGAQDIAVSGYGLGNYLLADSFGRIAKSTDTLTWVGAGQPLGGDAVTGFATNGTLVVAAGADGKVYTSTDVTTWTSRSSTFGTSTIRGIVWSGTQFVIVGDGGKLATSPDGITWTSRTSSFSTTDIRAVTFGASTYVAVGYSGKAATSSDGITWTQRTSSFGTTNIFSVIYGEKFVATGAGTTVATSTDGITWTQRTNTVTASNVAYGNSQYLMVGSDGFSNGLFSTSSDGITWTNFTHYALADVGQYVFFGGGVFVIAMRQGRVAVSADGAFVSGHTINGIVYAATDGGSGVVATSQPSDGITYSASSNAGRIMPNAAQIRFNSTGSLIGPALSDRIVRSLAAGTVSNDLTTVGALSCGLLTSYTSPSVYTEVSSAYHTDYARKVNNLAAGTGHKLTLAQAMNFSFPLLETTANITHLAVFHTSSGALAWVVPLPSAIPSGTNVASYSVVAGAFTLDFADASTVAP